MPCLCLVENHALPVPNGATSCSGLQTRRTDAWRVTFTATGACRYAYTRRASLHFAFTKAVSTGWRKLTAVRKAFIPRTQRPVRGSRTDSQGVDSSIGSSEFLRHVDLAPEVAGYGEDPGDIGIRTVFRDIHVVAFEKTERDPGARGYGTCLSKDSERLSSAGLHTAASAAAVVDFDDLDLGLAARAPDPETLSTARRLELAALRLGGVCDVTASPEDPPDDFSESGSRKGLVATQSNPDRSQGGELHMARSLQDDSRARSPAGFTSMYGSIGSIHHPRSPYSDAWQRRTPKLLSQMGSVAITDAVKTLGKLRSLAVSTHQSSNATLNNVDEALSLREQLVIVLMAAVFILYPTWAQAGGPSHPAV